MESYEKPVLRLQRNCAPICKSLSRNEVNLKATIVAMKMFDVNTEIIPLLTGFAIYANGLGPGLGAHSARRIFPITCRSNGCSGLHRRRSGTAVRNGAPRWTNLSCDGEFAAYVRFTDATLWRSKLDGSDRIQLT